MDGDACGQRSRAARRAGAVARCRRGAHARAPERGPVLRRAGSSLVELLVALGLTAVLLAAATGSMLRQQRAARWVGALGAAESQTSHALRLLPEELASLDAAA